MERSTDILSATDRLLLLAVRDSETRGEDAARLLAQENVAWKGLSRDSGMNRVDSFVADLFAHPSVRPRLAPGHAADWRARGMLGVFRMELAQKRVGDLGNAMQTAGIGMLAYKGVDFQLRCYSSERPRGFSDIDILVAPGDVERAAACLEAAGYYPADRQKPLAYYRRFHLHAVYQHPRHPWPIELHWALDGPFSAGLDPTPLILGAAESTSELGPGVLRPSSIDALALMCIHLDKHLSQAAWLPDASARLKAVIMESGLVWLLDIVRWMRQYAAAYSPDEILERMRQLDAERSYIIALRLADDLEPEALPTRASQQAARTPRRVPLIVRLIYPDLARGRAVDAAGEQRRAALYTMSQRGGFRPIRVLQHLLPAGRIPVESRVPIEARVLGAARRASLLVENAWALARATARERRKR